MEKKEKDKDGFTGGGVEVALSHLHSVSMTPIFYLVYLHPWSNAVLLMETKICTRIRKHTNVYCSKSFIIEKSHFYSCTVWADKEGRNCALLFNEALSEAS